MIAIRLLTVSVAALAATQIVAAPSINPDGALTPMPNSAPASHVSPLAPADQGFILCGTPDTQTKTCSSLSSYQKDGSGGWTTHFEARINAHQSITYEGSGHVTLQGEVICGTATKAGALAYIIRFEGRIVTGYRAKTVRDIIVDALSWSFDKASCTRYMNTQFDLIARTTVEGVTGPLPDTRIKWVRPQDGYRVAANGASLGNPWFLPKNGE